MEKNMTTGYPLSGWAHKSIFCHAFVLKGKFFFFKVITTSISTTRKMAKKLTEGEMLEEALKDPKIKSVWGALKDIIPEAVAEYKERKEHERSTDS